ncbi:hypothetical protein DRZ75_06035 [Klebsiella pneumoniae]|nr:hypothetical protein DKP79_13315 [Klebsiella pneumoniae]RBI74825.1 hypothetical protein DRZ75_06035 [Klebsiella pneumoniae]HBY4592844.1 hypothetical protein [Klebsiella pneumoniae]
MSSCTKTISAYALFALFWCYFACSRIIPVSSLSVSPYLAIWVVIKVLCSVCVIFNGDPEENQGMPSLR